MLRRAAFLVAAGVSLPLVPIMAQSSEGWPAVAHWPMSNTFGTTMVDSSGNGNDGTAYDVVTSGGGYVFNGTSSKVIVLDSPSLNPGYRDFAYSAQVQTNRLPPRGESFEIIRKGTSIATGGEYKLELKLHSGKAKAYCAVKDAAGNIAGVRGTTNISDGKLHTLTCIKTMAGLTLLVDDLAPSSVSATLTGTISNSKPLVIGAKQSTLKSVAEDFYTGTMRSATIQVVDGPVAQAR